jgi:hypothetical protein
MGKIKYQDKQPGSYFRELRNNFLGLKYFVSGMKKSGTGIRDGKIRIRDKISLVPATARVTGCSTPVATALILTF